MTGVDLEALLTEHGACEGGLAEAVAVLGGRLPPGVSVAWAVAVAAGVRRLRPWVGWAVGRLCRPEEAGVVAGAYLREVRLGRAQLSNADLRWADLCDADLWKADLKGADLRGADLKGADLREAALKGADLRGADLTHALRSRADDPIPGWVLAGGCLRRAE